MATGRNTIAPSWKSGFARSAHQSVAPQLRQNLLGAWAPFLGPQGLALYDVSGGIAHGTMSSATAPVWTLTNYGLGLVFTGDTVTLPTGSVFSTLGDFTVNATFIFGGGTGYQSLFAFGASGDDFLLGLVNARLLVYAVGVGESLPGSVLTSGTYYTATWSRLGSGLTFYLNGAVDATASYSATTITLSTSARLIGNDGGGEAFAGTLFDLRIYDRALTREEVLSYHRDYQLMYRLRPSRSFSVVSAGVALVETVTEDVEVSETHFRFLGFSRSVTEDIEVSETNPSFRGLSRVVTEDEEVSTAQSRNLVMVRTQQDDIQISDTVPRRMGMIRSILELENISSSVGHLRMIIKAIVEDIDVSSSLARFLGFSRTVTDDIEIGEPSSTKVSGFVRSVIEHVEVVTGNLISVVTFVGGSAQRTYTKGTKWYRRWSSS